MGVKLKGARRPDGTDLTLLKPGEYIKLPTGDWYLVTPNGLFGTISPKIHKITEHADKSISVSPSILVTYRKDMTWHGYLRQGVWETV